MSDAAENTRDPFAERSHDYDRWYHTLTGAFIDRVETALAFDMCPPRPGERVLDAGCGTGNFALKLARRGCRVTGVDISPGMLARAREHARAAGLQIRLVRADIRRLPLPDACYDTVYSMTAVEFIPELDVAHAELMRVLRPGGRLLIGTISREGPWGRAYAARAKRKPDSIFAHARFPAPEEVRALDPENLVDLRECLHIPPDAPEAAFTPGEECRRRAEGAPGGFFCALWHKPAGGSP